MTNVTNTHTFTTGRMNLIFATIFLLHGDLLKLVGDVVGGSAIDIPICVDPVGTIGSGSNFFFVL